MSDTPSSPAGDPILQQVGAASLRLMAGLVPNQTMMELRGLVLADREAFPWREVNERILADGVDDGELLQLGLRAERDWILRGGQQQQRPRRRKSLQTKGKTMVAYLLSRAIFFVLYTAAVVVLLVLAKQNWPEMDIYRILDWLREAIPGVFRPR